MDAGTYKLLSLTDNGYVKTGSGDGTLSVVTTIPSSDVIYDGTETVEQVLDDTINCGVLDAITITDEGGINISWSTGEIFNCVSFSVIDTDANGSTGCTDDSINYLYYDRSGGGTALTLSTTVPDIPDGDVLVGIIACENGDIFDPHEVSILNKKLTDVDEAIREIIPVAVTDGLIVSEDVDVTNAFDVEISSGTFFHYGTASHVLAAGFNTRTTAMTRWYHSGGQWVTDTNAQIDTTQYDNLTDLTAVTAAKYYKSMFMYSADMIHWIYPQAEYTTIAAAISAPLPSIPATGEFFPKSVTVIMRGNDAAFPTAGGTRWEDVRPIFGMPALVGVTDHGSLSGLTDDDHTQYLLANGSREISANWDAGAFEIRALTFESDQATGTPPFVVASVTEVVNLRSATASALAANGGNCAALSYPLGVDAAGAAEDCTDASTEIDSIVATHMAIIADTDTIGHLNDTDWDTFNNKLGAETNDLESVMTGVAIGEIAIGQSGGNVAVYWVISGEATMDDGGVMTLADSVSVSSWDLTTPTITTSLTTSTPKTISVAELDRLDGLAGIIATDATAVTDLEGTLLSIAGNTLNATEAQTFADVLGLGADGNDVDQTSLGRLTGFDAGVFLDMDADGVINHNH